RRLLLRQEGRRVAPVLQSRLHGVLRASAGAVAAASGGPLVLRSPATHLSGASLNGAILAGVKVLFASGSDEVVAQTLREFKSIFPETPLVVVSEFATPEGEWIPYHIRRTFGENRALIQSRLRGRSIQVAAIILEPQTPHWPMRFLAMTLAPWTLLAYSETGQHFRMRPDNFPVMLRHLLWRTKNLIRSQTRKGGWLHDTWKLLRSPEELLLLALYWAGRARPWISRTPTLPASWPERELTPGISV